MSNGYDQFFKKAQKAALKNSAPQSSKQTAEALRSRLKPQKESARKKANGIPWKLVGLSILGLCLAVYGLLFFEDIEKVVKNIEIQFIGQAVAETDKPSSKTDASSNSSAKPDESIAAAKSADSNKDFSSEELNHFYRLNERKRELDSREEELNKVEEELAAQKEELDKKLRQLESTRKEISSILDERVQADEKKVDTLVQVYSNMKPPQAAKIFETMDEDLVVEILSRMKKKNAADVLNLIKAEKAQILSEKYAGYKRKPASEINPTGNEQQVK
jgi:flagellar motility protein MotE (MotC chaperone)